MEISSNYYVHDSDRVALEALKAIPGFTPLLKAFMKVWSEKQFYIQNMSSNLRISEKQMSKYYDMLPPICEKLGIEVPELYLKLDVVPNAYTFGDTKPFIVITSGLLETLPEELIPTVLAHECGHIACHHCLYSTMGQIILSDAINYLGLGDLVALPIQVAFYYWMRCSELSADRAAAICDGTADKVVDMCMRFAGYDKDIAQDGNVDEFMNQAIEYIEMTKDSAWNKTLEFIMLSNMDHPLSAVRAFECNEWSKNDKFDKMVSYLNCNSDISVGEYLGELPVEYASKNLVGKDLAEVVAYFEELGFTNIETIKTTTKSLGTKVNQVMSVTINGRVDCGKNEWHPYDAVIQITYYEPETEEEVAAAHPGQKRIPNAYKRYIGKNYEEVISELIEAGFTNITVEKQIYTKKNWMIKEGSLAKISINGQTQFEKGEWFAESSLIHLVYNSFIQE